MRRTEPASYCLSVCGRAVRLKDGHAKNWIRRTGCAELNLDAKRSPRPRVLRDKHPVTDNQVRVLFQSFRPHGSVGPTEDSTACVSSGPYQGPRRHSGRLADVNGLDGPRSSTRRGVDNKKAGGDGEVGKQQQQKKHQYRGWQDRYQNMLEYIQYNRG